MHHGLYCIIWSETQRQKYSGHASQTLFKYANSFKNYLNTACIVLYHLILVRVDQGHPFIIAATDIIAGFCPLWATVTVIVSSVEVVI